MKLTVLKKRDSGWVQRNPKSWTERGLQKEGEQNKYNLKLPESELRNFTLIPAVQRSTKTTDGTKGNTKCALVPQANFYILESQGREPDDGDGQSSLRI